MNNIQIFVLSLTMFVLELFDRVKALPSLSVLRRLRLSSVQQWKITI